MSVPNKKYIYTGDPHPEQAKEKNLPPYIASPELIKAVNLAIFLERPLLLMGEPGCGKTRLAEVVACELEVAYKDWYINSTSKAKDGFYTYDALRRLHDAQVVQKLTTRQKDKFGDPENYISKKAFWHAFESKEKTVVLIDEIDKADIDFPNDLLRLLDENKFEVHETGKTVKANPGAWPIVIITSNGEKPLPKAFLRRCLFHYIEFPDSETLVKIAGYHFPNAPRELASKAVDIFLNLRNEVLLEKGESAKKPSTSEFLDWLKLLVLGSSNNKTEDLSAWLKAVYDQPDVTDVISYLQSSEQIPFRETLLKDQSDYTP